MVSANNITALLVLQEEAPNMSWTSQLHFLDLLWIWRYEALAFAAVVMVLEVCIVRFIFWREGCSSRQPAKPKHSSREVSTDKAPTAIDAHKANQAVHREVGLALHSTDSN
jgi:hypothetical protein